MKMPTHSITKAFWPYPHSQIMQCESLLTLKSNAQVVKMRNASQTGIFQPKKVLQHCAQVTLPSSVIHSPNCFISNQVFAKSVSTQTPNANQNFLSSVFPNGGRHCLSIIYQTGHNPIKLTFSSTPTACQNKLERSFLANISSLV
jgi:hypothetical protein